ncbi:MAG: pyruvate carboxyltransferase [Chloroflexi bacterium]|nr:pyruvate carboxyltransferase [Chloroflexota bacterium]
MTEPWKTENWFVSPWNYQPEVTAGLTFSPRIKIHDITLRDGEQQAGIAFTKEDKVRIAEMLAEAGVHRIEAGMPAVSVEDEAAVKEIVRRNLGPEIFVFSRCMVDDVKRAVDCGVKGIVMEIPCSEHILEYAYRWPLEKALDLSIQATAYAREQGLYTVFFPIDATRAEMNWYLNLIERVAREGHMDALALVDTFGVLSPHAAAYFVHKTKERVKVPLETHFHGDFGLGVANTLAGLAAGAEVAHVTVSGLGERAGNAPLEETVMALLTMYGVDVGLNYEKLTSLSQTVRRLSGLQLPSNKPIVGDRLFQIESGIITTWFKNCGYDHATEVFPFRWELVGHRAAETVLGKSSGIDSITMWLDKMGLNATEEEARDILAQVKEASHRKKGLLDEGEFREIVQRVLKTRS